MKISLTQFNTTPLFTSSNSAESQVSPSVKSKVAPSSAGTEPMSKVLRDAQTELREMPDVDMERVMSLKGAIKDGKIPVNVDELAEAMLQYYRG